MSGFSISVKRFRTIARAGHETVSFAPQWYKNTPFYHFTHFTMLLNGLIVFALRNNRLQGTALEQKWQSSRGSALDECPLAPLTYIQAAACTRRILYSTFVHEVEHIRNRFNSDFKAISMTTKFFIFSMCLTHFSRSRGSGMLIYTELLCCMRQASKFKHIISKTLQSQNALFELTNSF